VWFWCVFYCLGLVADIGTNEIKWERDANVKSHKGKKGSEGNSTRRMSAPDEEIEEEDNAKDKARDEESSAKYVVFPVRSVEHLIEASRNIAREESSKNNKDNNSDDESSSISRAQKTQNSTEESNSGHYEKVRSFTNENREQSWMAGCSENVCVD